MRAWLLLAALLAVGCFDPIVGARCADGYVPCHGRCVASCTDDAAPAIDGARDAGDAPGDARTEAGSTSDAGTSADAGAPADGVSSTADAGAPADGLSSMADTASVDADNPATDTVAAEAPVTDVMVADAAVADASVVDANGPDAAAPFDAPADAAIADAAALDATVPDAAPPIDCGMLTSCPQGCVNLDNDPDNCGACGASCISGLCLGGVCQQRQAGHLVVIGHDYAVSRVAMDNIVGNAVFLAPGQSVNVLAYQQDSSDEEIRGTDAAIQRIADGTGRLWHKTVAAAADVPAALASADVFVIYAQSGASDATLLMLGQSWATSLSDFVRAGKTIVVLEGWYANGGTYQIVQQANLFHAMGRFEATGQTVTVVRPGDAVATRVPQTYRGERSTVWFATTDETIVVQVATDGGSEPVVVHLVF